MSTDQRALTAVEVAWHSQEVLHRDGIDGLPGHVWHPDIEFDMRPTGIPGFGLYEGAEAALQFLKEWVGSFDEWHVQLIEATPTDDSHALTVWVQTGTGIESGAPVDMRYAQIVKVQDGLMTRIRTYIDLDEARREAGLDD